MEVERPVKSHCIAFDKRCAKEKLVNRPQCGVQRSRVASGLRVYASKQDISNPGVERFMMEGVTKKVKKLQTHLQMLSEFGVWRRLVTLGRSVSVK